MNIQELRTAMTDLMIEGKIPKNEETKKEVYNTLFKLLLILRFFPETYFFSARKVIFDKLNEIIEIFDVGSQEFKENTTKMIQNQREFSPENQRKFKKALTAYFKGDALSNKQLDLLLEAYSALDLLFIEAGPCFKCESFSTVMEKNRLQSFKHARLNR